jgi:hypothetical protein
MMPSRKVVLSQRPPEGVASILPLTLNVGDSIVFNHRTYVIQQINVPDSTGQSVIYFRIPDAEAVKASAPKAEKHTHRPSTKPAVL